MKISIIIVNYNVQHFLEVCIDSVCRAIGDFSAEIIVVDNASTDGSLTMLSERFPKVQVIANKENVGFSRANNQAYTIAQGEYVLFLNPDTVMPEDFFLKTLAYMDEHPDAGALGPKLIDGKGEFAPDSKKSFPTLSVAIFKTLGIHKLFPRSPYFNKYYAVHVHPEETAAVEVLSGCCMLLRKSSCDAAGGAFDEDYFMYCEDVDLSYRIIQNGFSNIYFPEAELIHYKGESTRKATLSYVRIFNEALITFVKKHYSTAHASLFIMLIKVGIALRAVLGVVKNIIKALRMPLFDMIVLLLVLFTMHQFWILNVRAIEEVRTETLLLTIPVYVFIWLVSMYLNGAYDRPYRALRVIRGMIIGTILNLAYFGLLSASYRYSRAVVVFTGIGGAVVLVALHELLYWLGIVRYVRYDELPKKAVIIGNYAQFISASKILSKVPYAPQLAGQISVDASEKEVLGNFSQTPELLKALGIKEVIFCVESLRYDQIFHLMQTCGPEYDYKIHLPGARSFVGSNSSISAGDLYTIDRRYKLSDFAQQRNKRVFDLMASFIMIVLSPFMIFILPRSGNWLRNIFRVLSGKRSWVGYASSHSYSADSDLPILRKGILPCYVQQPGFDPSETIKRQQDILYAEHYAPGHDLTFLLRNRSFWGSNYY